MNVFAIIWRYLTLKGLSAAERKKLSPVPHVFIFAGSASSSSISFSFFVETDVKSFRLCRGRSWILRRQACHSFVSSYPPYSPALMQLMLSRAGLINAVAKVVNSDHDIGDLLKVRVPPTGGVSC